LNIDENTFWRPPPPQVTVPHPILIQSWCKYSLRPLSTSSTYSFFNSYSRAPTPTVISRWGDRTHMIMIEFSLAI
jgi:hypothetical protein